MSGCIRMIQRSTIASHSKMKSWSRLGKCLLMAFVVMPLMSLANTEIVDGIEWTFAVSDGQASIGQASRSAIPEETAGMVVIPSTLGGCPVTAIGNNAFSFRRGLMSVIIPSSVTRIGEGAFQQCSGLTSVTIPPGVTEIGSGAFYRSRRVPRRRRMATVSA